MFKPFLKTRDFSLPLLLIEEGDNLFIRNKNTLTTINSDLVIKLNVDIYSVFVCEDNPKLARGKSDYRPYIINSVNDIQLLDENLKIGLKYVYKYPYYIGQISKDIFSPPTYFLKNIKSNDVVWESNDILNPKLIDNKIFSDNVDGSTIKCFQAKSLKFLWQQNLSSAYEGLKISRFVGVCKNILVLGLGTTNDANNYLVGINVETGEVFWDLKSSPTGLLIDHTNSIIHGFLINYIAIDVLTGKIIDRCIDRAYFEENEIETQRNNFVQVGNHLITTDWRKGKIGAFNTKTHKFDWLYEEEGVSFPGGSPMLYKAPYLFVQDNKHTVHIFEKQDNIAPRSASVPSLPA